MLQALMMILILLSGQHSKGARSFRGQNILEPGHPDTLFTSKKLSTFFSRRHQNRRPPTPLKSFQCQNKTKWLAVRYGKIFIFCSHYYWSKAKQWADREPGWWIFQPSHLTWRALV